MPSLTESYKFRLVAVNSPQDKGEIVVYLEEGQLIVEVDGVEYELQTGDSLHFAACHSYTWRNASSAPTIIMVLSSASDSLHPTLTAQWQQYSPPSTDLNSARRARSPLDGPSPFLARG